MPIEGTRKEVLDYGFVKVVSVMGDDAAIVQAARVSYGPGTKSTSEDEKLIRYLMRHHHTSPFEMCEIKLHVRCPIFVARQWLRHRTASVNELSGRYSTIITDFHLPSHLRTQSQQNRQGRSQTSVENEETLLKEIEDLFDRTKGLYKKLLDSGVAREQARTVLPLATYTEFYWKIDLHNLLHFLELRLHPTAQEEIRAYANAISEIVQEWAPLTWKAFKNYVLEGAKLSKKELENVRTALTGSIMDTTGMSRREIDEFKAKIPELDYELSLHRKKAE